MDEETYEKAKNMEKVMEKLHEVIIELDTPKEQMIVISLFFCMTCASQGMSLEDIFENLNKTWATVKKMGNCKKIWA